MEVSSQLGGRIRRLRRLRRISQAELAASLNISASYLNLIEHNRRKLTVPLLFAVAGYFGVEPGALAETDEARLTGDLMELFGDELFADTDLTNQDIRDFAQSHPVIARAVMRLFDQYRHATRDGATPTQGLLDGTLPPITDAVSDLLQENANHFPTIEAAAERVRGDIDQMAEGFDQGLRAWLNNVFGLDWQLASLPHGMVRRLSPDGRRLEVADTIPRESALFAICQHVGAIAAKPEIDAILDQTNLAEGNGQLLARGALVSYFAAALMMPYDPFLAACLQTRYDIDRLGRRFGASFEQVCHRMTTLQRPGAAGIPLHLVRTDIAGNISKRFSMSGIHIPRHAGACPRWNLHSAFLSPGRINVQISQMPSGEVFFCLAKSYEKDGHRHNAPRRHFSIGLGCEVSHARRLVYSDGIELGDRAQIVPVGPACQVCPRRDCEHRAHPTADHRFRIDDPSGHDGLSS